MDLHIDVEDAPEDDARLEDALSDDLVVLELSDILGSNDPLLEEGDPGIGDPGHEELEDRGVGLAAGEDVLDEGLLRVLRDGGLGELRVEVPNKELRNKVSKV